MIADHGGLERVLDTLDGETVAFVPNVSAWFMRARRVDVVSIAESSVQHPTDARSDSEQLEEEQAVDTWKFYDVTHRDHVLCNPTSVAKLDELIGLLDLPSEPQVLDIACGKGELLLRLAEAHAAAPGFRGVGVDVSPFFIAEFREAAAHRVPAARLELVEMDGAAYRPEPETFDLASCLGASWIFKGHRGSLRALRRAVRPGGKVLVGEPFWRSEPDPAYLSWSGLQRDDFGSHEENVEAGAEASLVPLLALVSNGDEWDRYETLQWRAAARYAQTHPDDVDLPELLERVDHGRHEFLAWGRETLGWALYLFERPLAG